MTQKNAVGANSSYLYVSTVSEESKMKKLFQNGGANFLMLGANTRVKGSETPEVVLYECHFAQWKLLLCVSSFSLVRCSHQGLSAQQNSVQRS